MKTTEIEKKERTLNRVKVDEKVVKKPGFQTPNSFTKVNEVFFEPSRTIPNRAISIKELFGYIEAGEPIPARFMANRRVVDADMDGINDAEVRMLDQLDELFALRSSEENKYFENKAFEARQKLRDSEAREAQLRKQDLSSADSNVMQEAKHEPTNA